MGRASLRQVNFNMGGEVQDSDYLYDNRQGEYSRSLATTHGSSAQDVEILTGPYPNLNSSYQAQFISILAGVETRWQFIPIFGLDIKWLHSWFNYHSEANWNMRSNFQHPTSFYQDGEGMDNRWSLGLFARLDRDWRVELAPPCAKVFSKMGRRIQPK